MPSKRDSPILLQFALVTLVITVLWPWSSKAVAAGGGKSTQISADLPAGLMTAPASLKLTTTLKGVVIRYTVDGSEPTMSNGETYSGPLKLSTTTLLRAAAFRDRERVSGVAMHSYIFLDQILSQPKEPAGFPSGPRAWRGMPPAYQMDPRVVNDPAYRNRMAEAFRALPLVSLVSAHDDLFGPGGLYLNPMQHGSDWEKACSAEMIPPNGSKGFQIDCGLRIQGGSNRIRSPKHSFRLDFKEKYGAGKLQYAMFPDSPLKKFDSLVLRADYNNSWIHWDPAARLRAQRTRDAWMKDSHRAMGWVAAHNRYVHLFLNGLYWGVYDFTERPDANFAAAYLGGTKEDYDVVNEFDAKDGTLEEFNAMRSITNLGTRDSYEKLQRHLDMTNFIDYVLLNYYAGNQDWGEEKNWYAIRRRTPNATFQYFVWDGEQLLHDVRDNTVSDPFVMPFRMVEELKRNLKFREAFGVRVQKHCFGEGALTPAQCAARWIKRAEEVDVAIIAESARWGYYQRNPPYTRDKEWVAEQKRLLNDYFPKRTEMLLKQLQEVGLYSPTSSPASNR